MGNSGEDTDHFLPKKFRWYTLGALILLLGLGIVVAISGLFNFLLLSVGEFALYFIYQRKWRKLHQGIGLVGGQKADTISFPFGRYVLLTWVYAMIMEFCVDFGAYGTINPGIVLVIMVVLTPHYFFMAAVFRLWFRWYTYSPRQAYFTIGIVGFLLESVILKLFAGTFELSGILLFPIDAPVHMLNYGGFVLIPTLRQNQAEQREPVRTRKKYLVGILGTLALTLPEIAGTYWFVYKVLLKENWVLR
jgi:hypothetical protein